MEDAQPIDERVALDAPAAGWEASSLADPPPEDEVAGGARVTDEIGGSGGDDLLGAADSPVFGIAETAEASPDGAEALETRADGVDLCPFLAVPGARWRSVSPDREHRCLAVRPPGPLTLEKQRRLCLTATHVLCPSYEQAYERRATALASAGLSDAAIVSRRNRPYVRTAPLVIDPGPAWRRREPAPAGLRRIGQVLVVALVVLAAFAFVGARLVGGGPAGSTPLPSSAAVADGAASASASSATTSGAPVSSPTGAPATPRSTAAASPTGSPVPSSTPSPGPGASSVPSPGATPRTYTIRSGDTLSGIAIRFHTTVAALVAANSIKNPGLIHAGQVLVIP